MMLLNSREKDVERLLHQIAQCLIRPASRNLKRQHGPGPEVVAVGCGSGGFGGHIGGRNRYLECLPRIAAGQA